jgi:hypothetical protein
MRPLPLSSTRATHATRAPQAVLAALCLCALCLFALWLTLAPARAAAQDPKKKPKRPAVSQPKDMVSFKVAWSLGSDRRGQIDLHICSLPYRNADAGGGCKECDIASERLVEHQGSTTLTFREGVQYNICFVATDTFNRPGTWGACQVIQAMDGVTFRFTEDMFEFWYGGRWQDH